MQKWIKYSRDNYDGKVVTTYIPLSTISRVFNTNWDSDKTPKLNIVTGTNTISTVLDIREEKLKQFYSLLDNLINSDKVQLLDISDLIIK